jgi:hypothetical protein
VGEDSLMGLGVVRGIIARLQPEDFRLLWLNAIVLHLVFL